MNRKKTGTGPDRNRLQPDLRLRFIRPENFTSCGSSKFGKWVNRYRAGWDRSQPPQQQHLDSRNDDRHFDNLNGDTLGDTLTACNINKSTTMTIGRNNNTSTTTNDDISTATRPAMTTRRQLQQQRVDNHDPQRQRTTTATTAATSSTTTRMMTTTTCRQRDGYHDAFTLAFMMSSR
ncbi:hypothetical protein EDB84DRAFT_1443876 [Lactarius hengduanensis]|nr:hypothetical protein EDB84DRAFT_1443876 [Lactarius hengduanensis]